MEFGVNPARVLDAVGFSVWDAASVGKLPAHRRALLQRIVDELGQASAKAQGLRAPITTLGKLTAADHRLYLLSDDARVLGLLKVGPKRLFLRSHTGSIVEIEPLCVLDFYVHESSQRQGVGIRLFRHMLHSERTTPERLGYDRPSPKLISFLARHFRLHHYVPQANNFVVFDDYFSCQESQPAAKATAAAAAHTMASVSTRPLTAAKRTSRTAAAALAHVAGPGRPAAGGGGGGGNGSGDVRLLGSAARGGGPPPRLPRSDRPGFVVPDMPPTPPTVYGRVAGRTPAEAPEAGVAWHAMPAGASMLSTSATAAAQPSVAADALDSLLRSRPSLSRAESDAEWSDARAGRSNRRNDSSAVAAALRFEGQSTAM